jgi:hypothetical protein
MAGYGSRFLTWSQTLIMQWYCFLFGAFWFPMSSRKSGFNVCHLSPLPKSGGKDGAL